MVFLETVKARNFKLAKNQFVSIQKIWGKSLKILIMTSTPGISWYHFVIFSASLVLWAQKSWQP
jgi:hypothetical protein